MIEGYQLSLLCPEEPAEIQRLDVMVKRVIEGIGTVFRVGTNDCQKMDPKIVVTSSHPHLNERVRGVAYGKYIVLNHANAGDKESYIEETMHFMRINLPVKQDRHSVVEEFFGGLAVLIFSDINRLTDRRYSLSKLSNLIDEIAKEEGLPEQEALEFRRDSMRHRIGYRLADLFYQKRLIEKYPDIFNLEPQVILNILLNEGAKKEVAAYRDIYLIDCWH